MLILPAIDIINKKPVRLYKGDYEQVEEVATSVLAVAEQFFHSGAPFLHVVDLDGAKAGKLVNRDLIVALANQVPIPIEVGGGIRSMEAISYYLEHGIHRVILGTSAIEDETLLLAALSKYGDRIVVGVDFKDGYVYGRGWLEASNLHYIDFVRHLETIGVKTIIVTDISKDGTLEGVNIELFKQLKAEVKMNVIASGGIKGIEDVKQLKVLDVYGAIIGKAIYHQTLDLKEAIHISEE